MRRLKHNKSGLPCISIGLFTFKQIVSKEKVKACLLYYFLYIKKDLFITRNLKIIMLINIHFENHGEIEIYIKFTFLKIFVKIKNLNNNVCDRNI